MCSVMYPQVPPPTWGGGEVLDGTFCHVPPPVKNNSYINY